MYEELVKALRETDFGDVCVLCESELCRGKDCVIIQAADAIERLGKDLERSKEYETFWEKEANEALKKFQTTVASIPRWIPVTERLPKEMETVIVTTGKNVGFSFCVNDYGTLEFYSPWNITHWMPLPEPPKEG